MNELIDRLDMWRFKTSKQTDPWVYFALYWIMLDAYLTFMSNRDQDELKLQWFIATPNELKDCIPDIWLGTGRAHGWLEALALMTQQEPILDMRPSGRGTSKTIHDATNIDQIIRAIYQIRCNMFHGAKNIDDPRDATLVELAGNMLKDLIDGWLSKHHSLKLLAAAP